MNEQDTNIVMATLAKRINELESSLSYEKYQNEKLEKELAEYKKAEPAEKMEVENGI